MDLPSLTLQDMTWLSELSKTRSIRELARRFQTPPGQVSKAIQRLERKCGAKLIERSQFGVTLTAEGRRFAAVFGQILEQAGQLEEKPAAARIYGVGATSFLINHLLATAAPDGEPRLRFLEMNPDQLTVAGLRHAFELAFHFGKLEWPGSWHQEKIGEVRWSLCARYGHPLGKSPVMKDILQYPFVLPAYWSSEGLAHGNDSGPIPLSRRRRGHETATAEAALHIVRVTDQLAYLPDLLIEPYEQRKEVRRLEARGGGGAVKQLYVAVRAEAMPDKTFQFIKSRVEARLSI